MTELPYFTKSDRGVTGSGVAPMVWLDGKEFCEHKYVMANGNGANEVVCVCFGDDREANAVYISKACNLHDELVRALEVIAEYPEVRGYVGNIVHDACLEVLKKAKE